MDLLWHGEERVRPPTHLLWPAGPLVSYTPDGVELLEWYEKHPVLGSAFGLFVFGATWAFALLPWTRCPVALLPKVAAALWLTEAEPWQRTPSCRGSERPTRDCPVCPADRAYIHGAGPQHWTHGPAFRVKSPPWVGELPRFCAAHPTHPDHNSCPRNGSPRGRIVSGTESRTEMAFPQ